MKLTKKNIEVIKKGFKFLVSEFNIDNFDGDLNDELNDDSEYVYFPFPKDPDVEVDKEYLVLLMEQIESIKIHDFNKVTTDTITQRVVVVSSILYEIHGRSLLFPMEKNNIHISVVSDPILIGIAATKRNEYSKMSPPCSMHSAVNIFYSNKESRLSEAEEEKLIKAYFFECAHLYNISISFETYHCNEEVDFEEMRDVINDIHKRIPQPIEEYNEGMELFLKANQLFSADLKYFSYYKIFEFFGPIYSKINGFEAMRKKLDSSNAAKLSAKFISSIFEIAENYQKGMRDKELMKALINNTFDLIDIFPSLPDSIIKKLEIKEISYSMKKADIDKLINTLSTILYSTRNKIVHAKSNYSETGFECPAEDLEKLNEFMHKACYSTIKWYNRLPEHQKNI